ncbi:hypothetical protein VP1G_09692 [Cytospora mali]|uniref:C2H2-type domain-containing protein n=1 Tax=Cytospora mali TaxID=578113 RepID=A0A194VEZ7_CYTMA|nr:hypothetical protein VP1G_09692 [Valsa mali var. pyri (nom. inval.)]
MDHHTDHMGHGHGSRPAPDSASRQLMMPPFQSLPPQPHYPTSDIPRRSVADGTAMPLQTSPIAMNGGGSSPESHAGSAGYTWGTNDSWAGRSPQHYGNRAASALNQAPFFFHNVNTMPSTTANNISPITATTPGDALPSFHSSPATSMSHLSIDQANNHASNNGILPPFRQNSAAGFTPRPTPQVGRSSAFSTPPGTMQPYVPGISSIFPTTTVPSSTRPGLAAPLSPLGSTGHPGAPPPGPGRVSPYSSAGHPQQHQYMHNLGNPGQPMALVSHYPPQAAAAAAAHKRIHWAVKPFPCDGCDKAFSRKDALKRHKLVKCCGKEGKDREGSPASSVSQVASGEMSPEDSKR